MYELVSFTRPEFSSRSTSAGVSYQAKLQVQIDALSLLVAA